MTAYGLMQFLEMKEVLPDVSSDMMKRVLKWLIDRKDDKGGFKLNQKSLDTFGQAPANITK